MRKIEKTYIYLFIRKKSEREEKYLTNNGPVLSIV